MQHEWLPFGLWVYKIKTLFITSTQPPIYTFTSLSNYYALMSNALIGLDIKGSPQFTNEPFACVCVSACACMLTSAHTIRHSNESKPTVLPDPIHYIPLLKTLVQYNLVSKL